MWNGRFSPSVCIRRYWSRQICFLQTWSSVRAITSRPWTVASGRTAIVRYDNHPITTFQLCFNHILFIAGHWSCPRGSCRIYFAKRLGRYFAEWYFSHLRCFGGRQYGAAGLDSKQWWWNHDTCASGKLTILYFLKPISCVELLMCFFFY